MARSQSSQSKQKYAAVMRISAPACKLAAFDPSHDFGAPLFDAGILRVGFHRLRGHFRAGSEYCATHLLHATISGEIVCEAGDKPLRVRKGEVLIAPARGPHRLRMTKSPCTVAWIHIRQTPQWEFLRATGREVRALIAPGDFENVMEAIVRLSRPEGARSAELMFHYAEILLILLSRELEHLHSPADRAAQIRLLRLWDAVREDPAHDWSATELAERVGLSSGYLPEICRRHFGVTPMQKVTSIRMEQARDLLRMTNLTLAEIAGRVGYETEYAFSDAFKRLNGCRPGAFRCSSAL
ncbi:MAG: helix-turn-helix transcriptional regulator [Verrucomicrobia bacterium]|jgi:AraC-like DNA-binding protein|nr:helix-turn-helix transcriptional regulator [Verrucomicrobiota bacterium]